MDLNVRCLMTQFDSVSLAPLQGEDESWYGQFHAREKNCDFFKKLFIRLMTKSDQKHTY